MKFTRPITREVDGGSHGPLVVTFTAQGVVLREKGRRHAVGPLPYGALYTRGLIAEADARFAERKKRVRRGVLRA